MPSFVISVGVQQEKSRGIRFPRPTRKNSNAQIVRHGNVTMRAGRCHRSPHPLVSGSRPVTLSPSSENFDSVNVSASSSAVTITLAFGTISAFLLVVGALPCYLPALRAMRIEPSVALQYEQARHYFFPTTSRTAVAT